jgi:hypothetical protein
MTFSPHIVYSCRLLSSAQLSNDALLLALTTSHVYLLQHTIPIYSNITIDRLKNKLGRG